MQQETKTLYISDLDGTLLNPAAELTAFAKDTLNKLARNNLSFTVATARTAASALQILEGVTLPLPLVLMNGVLVYDTRQNKAVKAYVMSPKTVSAVLELWRRFAVSGLLYTLEDGELTTYYESLDHPPLRRFVEERIQRYGKTFVPHPDFTTLQSDCVAYFTTFDSYDRLEPVYKALLSLEGINAVLYKDNYNEGIWYLEVFSAEASKGNATRYLRDTYGFARVVGFGDNLNDMSLFEVSDLKIAVANARDELKARADHICESHETDGVAKWLAGQLRL